MIKFLSFHVLLQIEFGDLILVDAKHECSIISVCRLQQIELFADFNGSTDVHICSLGFTCAIVLRQLRAKFVANDREQN